MKKINGLNLEKYVNQITIMNFNQEKLTFIEREDYEVTIQDVKHIIRGRSIQDLIKIRIREANQLIIETKKDKLIDRLMKDQIVIQINDKKPKENGEDQLSEDKLNFDMEIDEK